MAELLKGKELALRLRKEMAGRVDKLVAETNVRPGLAVVLVGNNPASEVYVRNKGIACREAGFHAEEHRLDETVSQDELHALIDRLNADPRIHGILVQFPLPKGLDETAAILRIDPDKDADGLHPLNLGRLVHGIPAPLPCTPHGVMQILADAKISAKGKNAVVIGRSNIVGKPMALLLLRDNATVTICHSHTQDLPDTVGRADIVVAAVGKAGFVKGEWIKEGAAVIDVGINRGDDGKLRGDVEFETASRRAAAITPVPGGVGPMTIAMLLENAFQAAARTTMA